MQKTLTLRQRPDEDALAFEKRMKFILANRVYIDEDGGEWLIVNHFPVHGNDGNLVKVGVDVV